MEIVKEPIYKQLNNILRDLLDSDTYQISDKFLTERVICKQFDVSRSTANKAISNLVSEGLLEAMQQEVNRERSWYDVLIERLRSGRGSAVTGQKRGRFVEDFVEEIVRKVFGGQFDSRCNFYGQRGQSAKCDVAIPNHKRPTIVIEAKARDSVRRRSPNAQARKWPVGGSSAGPLRSGSCGGW